MPAPTLSSRAHERWLLVQAVGSTGILALYALEIVPIVMVAAWVAVSFASLVASLGGLQSAADGVTAVRVVLTAGWILLARPGWTAFLALGALLLLDLLDGWIARREGPTARGAVYDMEADQLVVTSVAAVLVGFGLPPWILMLAGLKYLSLLAAQSLSLPLGDPKPKDGDNRRGRVICAFVLGSLWLGALPLVPPPLKTTLLAAALGLLAFSFGDDFWFQLRTRGARGTELS